jgi:hypothetical protein
MHTVSSLFGMLKREEKYRLSFSDLGTMVNLVYNLYLMMAKRLTAPNHMGSIFRQLELSLTGKVSPTGLSFITKS